MGCLHGGVARALESPAVPPPRHRHEHRCQSEGLCRAEPVRAVVAVPDLERVVVVRPQHRRPAVAHLGDDVLEVARIVMMMRRRDVDHKKSSSPKGGRRGAGGLRPDDPSVRLACGQSIAFRLDALLVLRSERSSAAASAELPIHFLEYLVVGVLLGFGFLDDVFRELVA